MRVWQQDSALIPSKRIVLRSCFVGPDRVADPALVSRLTLTLMRAPNKGTLLELTHERLGGLRAHMPGVADDVGPGWESTLDVLLDALGPADWPRSANTSDQERRR